MLQLEDIVKSHRQPNGETLRVLSNVNMSLERGESQALLGESGSGKSTLLHLIAGLDHADTGHIFFNQKRYSDLSDQQKNLIRRQELSLIFQQYHLIASLDVADNIRIQANLCNKIDEDYFTHLTKRLNLTKHLNHYPHQLSGGQQQRVAIARALLHRPKLILADEPTGNLDETTSKLVMDTFFELIQENNTALLMVTHSPAMAGYCDTQWQLHNGHLVRS
ncbi:ABC transporter ATP-binding protein [Bermanella marisrubri]|nr:ABC transporter ATP-binding protein [Bermanella marisrubri]QIZ85737.1 ABC transporter ATP-binding protein [Bermanella marisrubri]